MKRKITASPTNPMIKHINILLSKIQATSFIVLLFSLTLCRVHAQTNQTVNGTYTYSVPATGNYTFTVVGADGGDALGTGPAGGSGARMVATFALTVNSQLTVFVGKTGQDATSDSRSAGGGGGGTAVILNGTTVLIAAGAGGGGSRGTVGGGALANTNPTAAGGTALYASGGGGFGIAGANSTSTTCPGTGGGAGSLTTIGAGGSGWNQGCSSGGNGGQGFGGGGGQTPQGGGGGGGYAGGNGATSNLNTPGSLGGNSYVHSSGSSITATAGTAGGSGKDNTDGSFTSNITLSSVLPIELVNFRATPSVSSVKLDWQTANEVNNKGFYIEKQQGASEDWTVLGFVNAKGKDSSYDFIDNTPFSINYYRLRQLDNDGKETLSKVVSASLKGKGGLSIYPNPVSSLLTLTVLARNEATEGSDYQILNLLGQQVLTGKTPPSGVGGLDVSALPQGTYVIKVGAEQAKFVKQ